MIHPLTLVRNLRARLDVLRAMRIRPTDTVLEVGSGQNPNPRANVLCDRFLLDDTERNEQPVRVDRPFVVGDVYDLPFRDHAFDYVICAHVLEHLADPEAAARELGRVAPRGFVEVPSRVNEKLLSFPFHRWMIDREDDTLVFEAKERRVWDPELQAWFGRLASVIPGFRDRFFNHLGELGNVHRVVWEDAPRVRVRRPAGDPAVTFAGQGDEELGTPGGEGPTLPEPGTRDRILSAGARLLRRRSDPRIDLAGLLRCPECAGAIRLEPDGAACAGRCGRVYPVLRLGGRDVPYLLPGAGAPAEGPPGG